ncbi:SIR2 family protein [Commensalibacter oyaizuii]|uniref:SIR2 family protein n=1 Tax=Commensalibacter oyaizuii TaxID=3043873 RepID=A0ABT6Q468_9PROT|nr:SIR2 family protein [Commensalibacter sp. TBRC 16381]MDI2091899.1 SIR2 family protein [Commensalibacter sp. TBRC 16381]
MVDIEVTRRLLKVIASGKSMLFTGAGFSHGATNTLNISPPKGGDLAKILKNNILDKDQEYAELLSDNNLQIITDTFIDVFSPETLISILKENYTIKDVSETHKLIASVPWRRCYTTNYDEVFEIASRFNDKIFSSVTPLQSIENYYQNGQLCIHLNGLISNLNKETLLNEFKLSQDSYINGSFFIKNPWFYYFQKDLEQCPGIVIVGYSFYDYEFRKLFADQQNILKEKIFIITSSNASTKEVNFFEKYGKVLSVGVDGFSKLIEDNIKEIQLYNSNNTDTTFLNIYYPPEINHNTILPDEEIEKFLVFGNLDEKSLLSDLESEYRQLSTRTSLKEVLEAISTKNNVLLYSNLGNGKTIFLTQLKFLLSKTGAYNIYEPRKNMELGVQDCIGDIDKLASSFKRSIIVIDNLLEYKDIIKHYNNIQPKNICIVATSRRNIPEIVKISKSINFYEVSLDNLDEEEFNDFIRIIDNLSLWKERAGKSPQQKVVELRDKYQSQISYILLKVFESKNIQLKILTVLSVFSDNKDAKKTIFVISLLGFLDVILNFTTISLLSGNNSIRLSEFKNNDNLRQLFLINENIIEKRSSVLCQNIIRSSGFYDAEYIINTLLGVVENLDAFIKESVKNDEFLKEIRKKFLKSSTIEKILPEDDRKLNNLKRYYDDLKKIVPWLVNDPNYWVQYAMAHLTHNSLKNAQNYLKTAYSLAERHHEYNTDAIDTQQARLYLLLSMKEVEANKILQFFQDAQLLLLKVPNTIYRYKQVLIYKQFYDASFSRLSQKGQKTFIIYCNDMKKELEIFRNENGFDWVSESCYDFLNSFDG